MPKEVISTYNVPSEAKDIPVVVLNETIKERILEHLKEKKAECRDTTISARDLMVNEITGELGRKANLVESYHSVPHTVYALGQLLTYLRIPRPYYRRCPNQLKADNFNYWMKRLQDKEFFVRMWNETVRAFFTTRYSPEMDDICTLPVVLEALESMQEDNPYALRFVKTAGITTLIAKFQNLSTAQVEGVDWIVSGGIQITNSEIGLSSLRIHPVIVAWNHVNGRTMYLSDYAGPGARRFKHVGDTKLEAIKEATNLALQVAIGSIPVALAALETTIHEPEKEVDKLVRANPFITNTIIEGIAESLVTRERVTKGNVADAVIEACKKSIPFQTRMNEILEVERSAAKYLGFMESISAKLGDMIARGVEQERKIDEAEFAAQTEIPVFIPGY